MTSTLRSRSQRCSLNNISDAKALINIKYSNIPVNVPTLYPSSLKRKEVTLECFSKKLVREMIEMEPGKGKKKYADIKKNDQQDTIDVLIKNNRNLSKSSQKKKKGSMYISELWATKHLKGVIKGSKLDQEYETIKKAEHEGLKQKLEKLEKVYDKREGQLEEVDSSKIFEQFMTGGLNSPHLKVRRASPTKGTRVRSLDTKAYQETTESEESENLPEIRPASSKFSATTANLLKIIHSPQSARKSQFSIRTLNESSSSEKPGRPFETEPKTFRTTMKSLFHIQSPENKPRLKDQTSIDIESFCEKPAKPSLKISSIAKFKELNVTTEPTSTLSSITCRYKGEEASLSLPTRVGSISGSRNFENGNQSVFKPRFLRVKAASSKVLKKTPKNIS